MLEGGLGFVGSNLNQKSGYIITITDAVGKIHYPDFSDSFYDLPSSLNSNDDISANILDKLSKNVYYYSENQCLYYSIQHNNCCIAYIIVENIAADATTQVISILAQSELALKYHFSLLNKNKEDFGQSLWEHLFLSANASIPERLKLYEQNMDINNYYFVYILELEEGTPNIDLNRLRVFLYEIMHQNRSEYISSIIAPNRLVTIMRGNPNDNPMDINPDWTGRESLYAARESIEEKFHIEVSLGFGRVYQPSGLLTSYQEACIGLALARVLGKQHFIQFFSQLGVFTALFSNNTETLRNYCLQILGQVIEYDRKHRTDHLGTLRILLDNDCSWTTTANKLYVHVNTVYYRMLKVEKLLNVDFSLFETRLHLYTAIKVWDTLQICNFFENSDQKNAVHKA